MHDRFGIHAGRQAAEDRRRLVGDPPLTGSREHERPLCAQPPNFIAEAIERADAEDDADRPPLEHECAHDVTPYARFATVSITSNVNRIEHGPPR